MTLLLLWEAPNFDGVNTYGDETQILLPFSALAPLLSGPLAAQISAQTMIPEPIVKALIDPLIPLFDPIQITRTGFKEEDLLADRKATSLKADGALHYRFTDKIEGIYNYRFGSGSSVYQGSERYALRNFVQQFHKVEFRGSNWFLRGYNSRTDDGDSYNLTAMGAFANEALSPTASTWAPTYAGTYVGTLLGVILPTYLDMDPTNDRLPGSVTDAEKVVAHQAARMAADAGRLALEANDPERLQSVIGSIRNGLFQRGGAGFIDDSKLWHVEGNYDLSPFTGDVLGIQVGGNWRQYDLFTDGTIFNENPDGIGDNERIQIDEWGAYAQLSKWLADDRLKLTGSVRYDKNENFDGQFSPRVSAVYALNSDKTQNIRASYQTGFRNPTTQGQFIYFPTTNILVGGTPANAQRYGIYDGGAGSDGGQGVWTRASVDAYQAAVLGGADPTAPQILGLLQDFDLQYIQPEKLSSIEAGYKGILISHSY